MHRSSVPLFWRLQKSRYRLVGSKCQTCQGLFFPVKTFCPTCRRKGKLEDYRFAGNGTVVAHTVIRVPPAGFEKAAPYAVALIKLNEGVTVSGLVVGELDKIASGKKVRPVFRRISEDNADGVINYGIKFALVD